MTPESSPGPSESDTAGAWRSILNSMVNNDVARVPVADQWQELSIGTLE